MASGVFMSRRMSGVAATQAKVETNERTAQMMVEAATDLRTPSESPAPKRCPVTTVRPPVRPK